MSIRGQAVQAVLLDRKILIFRVLQCGFSKCSNFRTPRKLINNEPFQHVMKNVGLDVMPMYSPFHGRS